jgi:hypothetical protein
VCHERCCPRNDEYLGKPCQCAECWHTDGVCIDHSSGGGCHVCDGPVTGCDLTGIDDDDDDDDDLCGQSVEIKRRMILK